MSINQFKPLESVNGIKFGTSRKSVEKKIGPAEDTEEFEPLSEIEDTVDGVVYKYINKKLEVVTFLKKSSLEYKGIDVYKEKNIIELMKRDDADWEAGDGYVNFPNLGVCLGGFGNRKIPEGKLVYVYSKNMVQEYKDFLHV